MSYLLIINDKSICTGNRELLDQLAAECRQAGMAVEVIPVLVRTVREIIIRESEE